MENESKNKKNNGKDNKGAYVLKRMLIIKQNRSDSIIALDDIKISSQKFIL